MNNHNWILVIRGIIIIVIFGGAFYLLCYLFGPEFNNFYAKQQMDKFEYIITDDNIGFVDAVNYVGKTKDDEEFVIWIGIEIKTTLKRDALETKLELMEASWSVEIELYDHNQARSFQLVEIRKEDMEVEPAGGYLIGITKKPLTVFDKRNHGFLFIR